MATPSPTLDRVGAATIATGVLHNVLGAWLFRRQLVGIARDGVLDAVENRSLNTHERHRRESALWFLMSGAAFSTLGAALRRAEADDGAVLPIAVGMTAMGMVCAAVLPRSGAWLLIAEGATAWSVARAARARRTPGVDESDDMPPAWGEV